MRFPAFNVITSAALALALVYPASAATYRLLVVYTPAAESAILGYSGYHSTALTDYIQDYAIDLTNEIYQNSPAGGLAMPRVELAGIVKADYQEADYMQVDLGNIRSGSAGFSHVLALRNLYAADVVLLVTNNPNHSGAISFPDGSQGPVGQGYAYALSKWDRMRTTYTVAHEVGHVFGCAHDEAHVFGYLPYAHSRGLLSMHQSSWWGDVMAVTPNPAQDRQRWFSNPNLTYLGTPRGTHQTANCTRVHNERRHAVASFRTPQQYPIVINRTVGAHEYADIVGETVYTLSGVTFAAGSEGSIRAANTIMMFEGFKVEAGSHVSLRVEGSGALAKASFSDAAPAAHDGPEPAIPLSISLQVVSNSSGVSLRYALPEGLPVSYRVTNLKGQVVMQRTLGSRPAGRHSEQLRFEAHRGSVYFVELRAGATIRTQRFAIVQ